MTDQQSRQCGRKKIHISLEDAQARAKKLHKLTKRKHDAYQCPWCNGWHVGAQRSQYAARKRSERLAAKAGA